jgi:hypothetical protein
MITSGHDSLSKITVVVSVQLWVITQVWESSRIVIMAMMLHMNCVLFQTNVCRLYESWYIKIVGHHSLIPYMSEQFLLSWQRRENAHTFICFLLSRMLQWNKKFTINNFRSFKLLCITGEIAPQLFHIYCWWFKAHYHAHSWEICSYTHSTKLDSYISRV